MRSTNTFGVRFIIRCPKSRPNNGAIYARVTVNRQRIEIALKRSVDPANWNGVKGRVEGNKELAKQINPYIEEVRYKLMDAYQEMQVKGKLINAESIKRLFTGEEKVRSSLSSLLQYHRLTASATLRTGTMKNYSATEKYLFRFLKERHKANDMFLEELDFQFITEFELFLRTTKPLLASSPLTQNGIMKHMERFRKMVTLATKLQWLDKDPFVHYRLSFKKTERGFLSQTEIDQMANAEMPNIRLERCRDIFLFSCYTGLAYIDLFELKNENIVPGIDGNTWIKTVRQKTDVKVAIPLLPMALDILNKYRYQQMQGVDGRAFPCLSNQKVNQYLKEVAAESGISKKITFHLARHTFATTVTLNNGVRLETVSKLLGHSKLATTQLYAHVLDKMIGEEMDLVKSRYAVSNPQSVKPAANQ